MVPERLIQPPKMTDLLLEACPGRTGFSKSDMGPCPGEPVRGEQQSLGGQHVDFAGVWYLWDLRLRVASAHKSKRCLGDAQCPLFF